MASGEGLQALVQAGRRLNLRCTVTGAAIVLAHYLGALHLFTEVILPHSQPNRNVAGKDTS